MVSIPHMPLTLRKLGFTESLLWQRSVLNTENVLDGDFARAEKKLWVLTKKARDVVSTLKELIIKCLEQGKCKEWDS